MNLENIDTEKWLQLGLDYGLKILGAIVIWIIGSWVIKKILKATKKVMSIGDYDESLQKFLLNLLSWTLKIVLIIVIYWYIMVSLNNTSASSMKTINPTDNTTKIIKYFKYLILK